MSNLLAKIEDGFLTIKIPVTEPSESPQMMLIAKSGGFQYPQEPLTYNGKQIKINVMAGYYKNERAKDKKNEFAKLGW